MINTAAEQREVLASRPSRLDWPGRLVPGLRLAVGGGVAVTVLGLWVPLFDAPMLAILLGCLVRAIRKPCEAAMPGIALASKKVSPGGSRAARRRDRGGAARRGGDGPSTRDRRRPPYGDRRQHRDLRRVSGRCGLQHPRRDKGGDRRHVSKMSLLSFVAVETSPAHTWERSER
jgi:hypothetical protein